MTDRAARQKVLTDLDRTLLVEAAAGSGKTSLLAGRLVMLLASGVKPSQIAAITFTEMAAGELSDRVHRFVDRVLTGKVPQPLDLVMPAGPSEPQRDHLTAARKTLHELTCTTIHGFCRNLVTPYPVEADIDPGATVLDGIAADIMLDTVFEQAVREELSDASNTDQPLASTLLHDLDAGKIYISQIKKVVRDHREFSNPNPMASLATTIKGLLEAMGSFVSFVDAKTNAGVTEETSIELAEALRSRARCVQEAADKLDLQSYVTILRLHDACDRRDPVLFTQQGTPRGYRNKGKWIKAASSAAEGERINDEASGYWGTIDPALKQVEDALAESLFAPLANTIRSLQQRHQAFKRRAACLDFDDLLLNARQLLRQRPEVRHALAQRFTRVLVDEFQDTDPVQTEILFLLCGDDLGADDGEPMSRPIRPGQLFLVGDPKQAIYRFRGADIETYLKARAALELRDSDAVVRISASFRSPKPLIAWVNQRFEAPLNERGQPGYVELQHTIDNPAHKQPVVMALDVTVDSERKPSADDLRRIEAEAVGELCQRLIGNLAIRDDEGERTCRPRDVVLLAPQSTSLWVYERELEQRGIPIASTAGKGLYLRQEVQDLITLLRALSDKRDTLALGAFLRGPLVGLTEQQLLDAVGQLPVSSETPTAIPRLTLWTDTSAVKDPLLAASLGRLQDLAKQARLRTPQQTLATAIEMFRIRPLLALRSERRADRAMSNVDTILRQASAYEVRGLKALAHDLHKAWWDEIRGVEGRPDTEVDAVQLVTFHSAKGLEWPVVIPINAITDLKSPSGLLLRRADNSLHGPIRGISTTAYETLKTDEKEEESRERVRLWYVACTRARDLLVLPRYGVPPRPCWSQVVDLGHAALPACDLESIGEKRKLVPEPTVENQQSPEIFDGEARIVAAHYDRRKWELPSRHGGDTDETSVAIEPWGEQTPEPVAIPGTGGRVRGTLMHKLFEEILNSELADSEQAVNDRASELSAELTDATIDTQELAKVVVRALTLPIVQEHRNQLVPESTVWGSRINPGETMTLFSGVMDAVALDENGKPLLVIDWKSDPVPSQEMRKLYRQQVAAYLQLVGCARGAVVYVTLGQIEIITARD